ncbi:hypothetical protein LY90DRAFT_502499 [Neocallimastix californiae]|uniref:Uncharacterized protein n=1 Tax=Neocallimastix californiae TaxID=1754190 RepID=A0A1Y2ET02_9FUNG|nr:hypothetical protein LY90DRAFT_502499 [Neocallimastix californiae]|eukprot:ORY74700.1 hypothetical protein LY90DRAFT_502499 [Neocallimastix californiae]
MLNQKLEVPLNIESPDLQKYINDISEFENNDNNTQNNKNNDNNNENDNENGEDSDEELLDEELNDDEDDETIKIEDIDPDALIQENDFKSIEYEENLLNQIVRNKFIMTLKNIIGIKNLGNHEEDNEQANNIFNNYIEFLNQ